MYLLEHESPSPRLEPGSASLPAVERADRSLRALWRTGLAEEPALDAGALIRAARSAEGLSDFGDGDHWREPFELLLHDLAHSASLNALGRTMAHGQLVAILRQRLRATALWRRHPEIVERPVPGPIIVLGQMRSGTTRMQRLLACDPRFAHTRLFEVMNPVPFASAIETRPARAWAGLRLLHALNPALRAVHPTSPYAAEEEFGLLSFAFSPTQFEAQWRAPALTRWGEGADQRPVYAEFRRLLQTIGWSRGEAADKPWVLKAPQFMQDLDALLDSFPGARLLVLKRDPAAVAASSASLVWNQMRVQSDAADRNWIGREWLRKTALREAHAASVLAERCEVPRIEIDFGEVGADWRAAMRRVYKFLDLELTPDVELRMARYLARPAAHAGHRYRLEDFGLSATDVSSLSAGPPDRRPARAVA